MLHKAFHLMLESLFRQGRLTVHFPDGREHHYGEGAGPAVTIRLNDPALIRRLLINPDIALGEAYMDRALIIDNDDLHGLMELLIRNYRVGRLPWWQRGLNYGRIATRYLGQNNHLDAARRNVAHHYDLSGRLYDLFLDSDRQYSCAYFQQPDDTLEQAQAHKKDHIARKLLIKPGMRILDIGCGWGGLALTLARDHGARVLGVTLSQEQHRVATQRAAQAGLSDQVEFRLIDYRNVAGSFDRIVSVGMFEHVGAPHYPAYFKAINDLLTADGVALVHTIGRSEPPDTTSPWTAKYIFPGAYAPAMSEVLGAIEKQPLWVTDVECWRLHYAMTLRHWFDRFNANADAVRAIYDERFIRMWNYYLVVCEQSFRFGRLAVFQFQLAKKIDAVPITRDYLYSPAAADRRRLTAE